MKQIALEKGKHTFWVSEVKRYITINGTVTFYNFVYFFLALQQTRVMEVKCKTQ